MVTGALGVALDGPSSPQVEALDHQSTPKGLDTCADGVPRVADLCERDEPLWLSEPEPIHPTLNQPPVTPGTAVGSAVGWLSLAGPQVHPDHRRSSSATDDFDTSR